MYKPWENRYILYWSKHDPYKEISEKKCLKCKKILDSKSFGLKRNLKLGLAWICKKCRALEERHRKYRVRYGTSYEKVYQMWLDQDKKCRICSKDILIEGTDCGVDHDHKTGKVRGILCNNCNHLLGCALDNTKILKKAIVYLEEII